MKFKKKPYSMHPLSPTYLLAPKREGNILLFRSAGFFLAFAARSRSHVVSFLHYTHIYTGKRKYRAYSAGMFFVAPDSMERCAQTRRFVKIGKI